MAPKQLNVFCLICGREESEVQRMHCFPSVLDRSRVWQENMGMVFIGDTLQQRRICNMHFTPESYVNQVTWRLRKDAVPTLFPIRAIPQPAHIDLEAGPSGVTHVQSALLQGADQGRRVKPAEGNTNEIAPNGIVPNEIVPNEIAPHEIVLDEIVPDEIAPNETNPTAILTDQIQVSIGTNNARTNKDDFRFIPEKTTETMLMLETEDLEVAVEGKVCQGTTHGECRASNKVFIKALHRFPTQVPVGDKICVVLVCRICLASVISSNEAIKLSMESSATIEISDENGKTRNVSLLQMLSVVLPHLEIRPNMKTVLCKNCVSSLHTSYQLRMNWMKTEEKLQECLEQRHLRYDAQYDLSVTSDIQVVDNGTPQEETMNSHHEVKLPDCEPHPNVERTKPKLDTVEWGDGSYLCSKCGEVFQEIQVFKRHMNTDCHKRSRKRKVFEVNVNPLRKQKRTSKHQCSICNKVVSTRRVLEHHLKTIHLAMLETPYQCEQCGKTFAAIADLETHMDTHRNVPSKYKCNFCGQLYQRRSDLMMHRKQMHLSKLERLRKCDICGKPVPNEDNFNKHLMAYHMVSRGNHCQYCGKAYWHRKHLIQHLWKIHGEGRNARTCSSS